ncbi:helix-turn-helix transcriptional regulator [Faecalicoccus pleomorphus]|nr:helix-turn-helix transcriptional regulator [Faecalicoccus pleomorphus]
MSNLSQNIRKYREQKSMSQEELAQKLYVTRQTISNYENEKQNQT